MRVYVTGAANEDRMHSIVQRLKERGHAATTPMDVVDPESDEIGSLRARMKAVLDCEVVVTTNPSDGPWTPGAQKEVNTARTAFIKVIPASNISSL